MYKTAYKYDDNGYVMTIKTLPEDVQDLQRRLKRGSIFFTFLYSVLFILFLVLIHLGNE